VGSAFLGKGPFYVEWGQVSNKKIPFPLMGSPAMMSLYYKPLIQSGGVSTKGGLFHLVIFYFIDACLHTGNNVLSDRS